MKPDVIQIPVDTHYPDTSRRRKVRELAYKLGYRTYIGTFIVPPDGDDDQEFRVFEYRKTLQ
jgi:hypothetical protein